MGRGAAGTRAAESEAWADAAPAAQGSRSPSASSEGQGQARRWQGTDDPTHDGNELLAPRRNTDVCRAVHGVAIREAARILQGRGRATCAMEQAGHTQEAS